MQTLVILTYTIKFFNVTDWFLHNIKLKIKLLTFIRFRIIMQIVRSRMKWRYEWKNLLLISLQLSISFIEK